MSENHSDVAAPPALPPGTPRSITFNTPRDLWKALYCAGDRGETQQRFINHLIGWAEANMDKPIYRDTMKPVFEWAYNEAIKRG